MDAKFSETSSHKEENYNIILISIGQFTPEGYQDLLPQTIIAGKIKIPKNEEFCEFKKILQNGMLADFHYPFIKGAIFYFLFEITNI